MNLQRCTKNSVYIYSGIQYDWAMQFVLYNLLEKSGSQSVPFIERYIYIVLFSECLLLEGLL